MGDRLIFGKPLPRALRGSRGLDLPPWATLALLAGAGLVTWVVMALLSRDRRQTEDMVYIWPE
jgi:hypothetical protein